jgi:hypothetical protein
MLLFSVSRTGFISVSLMYSTESYEIYIQYDKQFLATKGARRWPIHDTRLADLLVDQPSPVHPSPNVGTGHWTNHASAGGNV